jgi:hypothetical protein
MQSRLLLALTCVGAFLLLSVMWFFHSEDPAARSIPSRETAKTAGPTPVVPRLPDTGPPPSAPSSEWQTALNDVLGAGENPSITSRKLIALVKTTPPAAQVELAQHILNLASGDDFLELLPLLKDRTLGVKFHRRIALGLLNQREDIKLRGVLEIATSDWHPMTQQFRSLLPVLTGENAEEDWTAWKTIIEKQIAEWEAEQKAAGEASSGEGKTAPAPPQ